MLAWPLRGRSFVPLHALLCRIHIIQQLGLGLHSTTLLALMALTTVLADSRPTALLALRALTTVLTECRPTTLLACSAPTTVLAD